MKMTDVYLPTDRVIMSKNGKFIIKEGDEGYELWDSKTNQLLLTRNSISGFRETIGRVIKIER